MKILDFSKRKESDVKKSSAHVQLTLSMLTPGVDATLSKAQGCKYFCKPAKSCHVGIH